MKDLLVIIGIILVSAALLTAVLSAFFRFKSRLRRVSEKKTVLHISVPKEVEAGPIVAEQIFSAIHGVYREIPFIKRLFGDKQDSVSFEISTVDKSINFYVAFPEKLRNLVEGQIYAQYPDAEILEVEDYTKTMDKEVYQNAIGAELEFTDADVFPIKRYTQFEDKLTRVAVDPLSGITSTLTKFNHPSEQAWIQIVATPLADKWKIVLIKCVKLINKGFFMSMDWSQNAYAKVYVTRKLWPKFVFFPLYVYFWIRGVFVRAGVKNVLKTEGMMLDHDDDVGEQMAMRSHERESESDACMDKVVRLLYDVNIRLVYVPNDANKQKIDSKIREMAGSFKQFNQPHLNGFKIKKIETGLHVVSKFRRREVEGGFIMSNEELATVYHLPSLTVKTPNITWVRSRKLEPPIDLPLRSNTSDEEGYTLIGKTNFRGNMAEFGIKDKDRGRHIYVIGKTGMGKSTLLENMIYSDVIEGKGVGLIDPHGDLADTVLGFIPPNRTNDVVLIEPSDRDFPVAFNMLENIDPAFNTIVCSGLVGIFKKIYADSWGPRLEHILRNTILSLLEYPGTTMLGITRILQDEAFRKKVVPKITDPIVKSFWVNEFDKMQDRMKIEAISPILNKVGQFLASPIIRNIVGQPKSAVDLRFAMDKGKIVIINLSKGKIGEDNSSLLGSMFITKFQLDAMSRANTPEKDRKEFYLYVDEFQNFATDAFATILSEARKYKLSLTMANQYIAQMPDEVKDAVFGNVGTLMSMQVGFDDAEYISQQFGEEVLPPDLVGMSKFTAYTRLLIDNMPSKTFSLDTLPPIADEPNLERAEKVRKVSRERYAANRKEVEDKIMRWSGVGED
ncbi:DUF87 domain-containing protein [Candidatus Peregrinibacteria bacterium]|jgi:hypothetical protein|nr:DUF87 domain-containing protein [Candidatus Peregrinibacteria bacterium]MBT4148342.1 DUF87 domain-containing protein [Candidatus Peregrinibacteria bacterium]MBT4455905.1 DUF87 domain-containing protein [Candidatus Peregrinibacteria bacterium]